VIVSIFFVLGHARSWARHVPAHPNGWQACALPPTDIHKEPPMNLDARLWAHAPDIPQPTPPVPLPYPENPPGRPTELPPDIEEPNGPGRQTPPEGDPPGKPNPMVTLH
jgi:hypothetical protein